MWFFDEVADWWDEQKNKTEAILTKFVEGTNSWWRIAIAGTVQTAMNLGGGFVDVLRLGEGIKEGGWRGFAQDGLRLLSIAGPIAKGARGVSRFVTKNPFGDICGWVATTQVLRQTGVRHFATIEDLVQATGKTPNLATIGEIDGMLRTMGAEVRSVPVSTMDDIAAVARANADDVVVFGVGWNVPSKGIVGHALYAYRDFLGRIRIVNRNGAAVKQLADLERLYPGIGAAQPVGAIIVRNAIVAKLITGASTIALEVRLAMLASRKKADAKMAEIRSGDRVYTAPAPHRTSTPKTKSSGGHAKPVTGTPYRQRRHTVKPGDTWISIASLYAAPQNVSTLAGILRTLSCEAGHTELWEPPKPGSVLYIPE